MWLPTSQGSEAKTLELPEDHLQASENVGLPQSRPMLWWVDGYKHLGRTTYWTEFELAS